MNFWVKYSHVCLQNKILYSEESELKWEHKIILPVLFSFLLFLWIRKIYSNKLRDMILMHSFFILTDKTRTVYFSINRYDIKWTQFKPQMHFSFNIFQEQVFRSSVKSLIKIKSWRFDLEKFSLFWKLVILFYDCGESTNKYPHYVFEILMKFLIF
jgi:hypothetical protein